MLLEKAKFTDIRHERAITVSSRVRVRVKLVKLVKFTDIISLTDNLRKSNTSAGSFSSPAACALETKAFDAPESTVSA